MLNGVGGCTVEEAKDRLTYAEVVSWAAYRRKRGRLNLGMRIEEGFAMLAAIYANTKSKHRYSRFDFMDHDDGPPVSLERAMDEWR